MKQSLSDKLLKYLKDNNGQWFKKVNLFIIADEAGYSPESAGRCLRTLAEEGKISVDYYDGTYAKHLAKYSYNPPKEKVKGYVIENGVAKEVYA